MDSNDLNRRVRYALMIDDDDVIDLLRLSAWPGDGAQVSGWRLKEGDAGFVPCPPDAVQYMLDGLIIQRRGRKDDDSASAKPASDTTVLEPAAGKRPVIDNNAVLKQLRIALSLKTDDVFELIAQGGGKIGKSEVNAFFRKPTARNYRRCGDQVLRWFLAGLTARRQSAQME